MFIAPVARVYINITMRLLNLVKMDCLFFFKLNQNPPKIGRFGKDKKYILGSKWLHFKILRY